MALSTTRAPVYGGSTLVIDFPEDTVLTPGARFYLVYEGSQQRHVTTARPLDPHKLHSIIPGHIEAEEVQLRVLSYHDDNKDVLVTSQFSYFHDGAFYLAQFLVDSVYHPESLEDLELIKSDHFDLADEDLATLDQRLSRALAFLDFPDWWSLLGADADIEDPKPRETILHFAARLGLNRVAAFLIRKPGSQVTVKLTNRNGDLPKDVALANGHHGLAELLSDYNSSGLMPLGGWFETEKGVVQTQETGDVTLTSSLQNHKRSIEEDIIVLQGVQRQLEEEDSSRPWQTPWPAAADTPDTPGLAVTDSPQNQDLNSEDTFQAICDKTKELPALVTMETVDDYRDNGDVFADPNLNGLHEHDHADSLEDITMETGTLPQLHIQDDDMDMEVLEDSVSTARDVNERLQRIREKKTVFNKILEQHLRKENLARFSSSCPSLDADSRNSPLPVIDEAGVQRHCLLPTPGQLDHHKSMVDLAEDNEPQADTPATPSLLHSEDLYSSGPDLNDSTSNVHIVVDNTTTESSTDFGLRTQEYDEFLKEYYGGNVAKVRRRSHSPKAVRNGDEGTNSQSPNMLIHGNKSVNLNAGEGDETDEDSFRGHDDSMLERVSAGTDDLQRSGHSESDLELQDRQDSSLIDEPVSNKGRGQGNKARYSADIEYLMQTKEHHSGSSLDKMASAEEEAGMLVVPHAKMTKALSTSSIPMATSADKHRGSVFKGLSHDSKHPTNFSNESLTIQSPKVKEKEKEEKKRKPSVFSRFHSSYRIKKNKDKEGKKSSSHRFVSVSFSNATTCDVCHKPLINKQALRCQICLLNVHENSCKEQINACDKIKPKGQAPRQASADSEMGYHGHDPGGSGLRQTFSFKEKPSTRPQSAFVGASTQPLPNIPANISTDKAQDPVVMRTRRSTVTPSQRRSLPTPSRPIAEEESDPNINVSRLDLGHSNITEAISQSTESLDEVDSAVPEVPYDDVELGDLDIEEPETWSETADRKVLKKMNPKDVKRQDTIWELIQTERQYCKRLKTLQVFFRDPMLKELQMPPRWVDRMFPQLSDLIQIHMAFYRQLQMVQGRRADRSVEEIGHTLHEQFSGESAEQMKSAYGVFCSGHLEAVQLYKDFYNKDKKFQSFIKQRMYHPLCKKREVPDFILLITQRPTKYPTLIEAVIKSTKDKKEREWLVKALDLSKEVLMNVNEQVAAAERKMRLKDICNRLDKNSFAFHRGKKFRKGDVLMNNRQLLHEGMIGLKSARGKSVEVLGVVLTDVLFFLTENNQKYSFFSQDNKYCVISLYNLLVREKCDRRETRGLYLISQNKTMPEMYEVVFNSTAEMQRWAQTLRAAVEKCPPEEEDVPTEAEEEKRRMEERSAKVKTIMEQLHQKDEEISRCCDAKNKLIVELTAVYSEAEEQQHHSRPSSRDFDEMSAATSTVTLESAIQEVSIAASQLTSMMQSNGSSLSRSVSSVGEHSSNTFTSVPVPKRADTFGGFDNTHELPRAKKKGLDSGDFSESPQNSMYKDSSDSDVSQYPEVPAPAYTRHNYEGEADSGRGSSPGAVSSASMLSPVSVVSLSQEQTNVAHILKTLNRIVDLLSRQKTDVETLRAQLNESNDKFNRLSADVHEKKVGSKHSQLEELRNLQGEIQKEKEEWEQKKAKETYALEQERLYLDQIRLNLRKEEDDLKQQKEELSKKRELLQKQMDMLKSHGQLPADTPSRKQSEDKSDSAKSDSEFIPGHRRSASAELFKPGDGKQSSSAGSKESNGRTERISSVSKLQSFSYKPNVPEHLLSAKNEQKIGPKKVQQIPSKLLSSASLGGSSPPLQHHSPTSKMAGSGGHSALSSNVSSVSLGNESGSHSDIHQMGHSVSLSQLSGQGGGGNTSVPKGNWQSNRPKPNQALAGLAGVMKLAEKGDKKSKGGSSQSGGVAHPSSSSGEKGDNAQQQRPKSGTPGQRNPNINHKPQKSDSDVIYF